MHARRRHGAVHGRVARPAVRAMGAQNGHELAGGGILPRLPLRQRLPDATGRHGCLHALAVPLGELRDRKPVGDAAYPGGHALGCAKRSSRLEHPRLHRIGNDEAVVVGEGAPLVPASSALAVALDQFADHRHGFGRGRRAFEGEAKQVHAGQTSRRTAFRGEHGLVADRHAMLVCPHLGSPHPEWPADHERVRLGDLRHLDPSAPDGRPTPVGAPRMPLEHLRLVRVAVGVLCQQDAVVGDHDDAIAHGRGPSRGRRLRLAGSRGSDLQSYPSSFHAEAPAIPNRRSPGAQQRKLACACRRGRPGTSGERRFPPRCASRARRRPWALRNAA